MRPCSPRSLGRTPATRVAALVLTLAAASLIPAGALAPSPAAGSASEAVATVSALTVSGFAERAGYSAAHFAEVGSTVPASGAQNVEITFAPTNPSFYVLPSPNASPMTETEIANDYGLSVPAYTSAEQYFLSEGLVVSHAWPDRLSLSVTGTRRRSTERSAPRWSRGATTGTR